MTVQSNRPKNLSGAMSIIQKLRDSESNLASVDELAQAISDNKQMSSNKSLPVEGITVLEIDPQEIKNWDYHDRPDNELGDIESLSKEFLEIGQQQPCLVRPYENHPYKFELIVGERRWRAASKAGINLKVLVKKLTDTEAALCQVAENSNRKDLSDYAKGMSYANLIANKIIKQSDLIGKLGLNKYDVSRLLSFRDIPASLAEAIGDFTQVSSRTASEIRSLCNKDPRNLDALLFLANKISSGIGANTLVREVKKYFDDKIPLNNWIAKKVYDKNDSHLFTWRKDGNGNASISIPKKLANKINYADIETDLIDVFQKCALL